MKDLKKIIVRRIYLLSTGKSSLLTEEEKRVIKEVDNKVTINLLEPNEEDYEKIEEIFLKYF